MRRADNLTTFMCRLSWNLGASTSWNPQGLSRPVMGLLYLLSSLSCDMIFIYCNLVSTGWQWPVNQTCKCFARTGTTMKMQWRGHVTNTAKIRNVHGFNWAIRTEDSTRQTEAATGGDDFKLVYQRNTTLTYLRRAFVSTVMDCRGSLQSGHFMTNEVT